MGFKPMTSVIPIEHRTNILEVIHVGSNPVGVSEFFLGFICNCSSYYVIARITFTKPCLSTFVQVDYASSIKTAIIATPDH